MPMKTFGLAAALAIALTGTAYAQQPAGGAPPTTHPRGIDAADLQLAGRLRCGA